jgi:FkbM family methyltransferase
MSPRKLVLRSFQSPGDIVVLTAAVRDLHLAHPGQFVTDVRTTAPALWENNPYIKQLDERDAGIERIDMHYPLIHQSDRRPCHFIHGYVQFLEQRLGVTIPVTRFAGEIHLSSAEQAAPSPLAKLGHEGPFWIVMAGGKYDFTAKWWNPAHYQAVVDHFRGRVQFVQCGEAGHWHPRLTGVVDLVGRTSTREFVLLMHHAAGVLCPVTFAMHLAAAVPMPAPAPSPEGRGSGVRNLRREGEWPAREERNTPAPQPSPEGRGRLGGFRPCVVVAGGREPAHWEQYPGHQFLHTIGALDCCAAGGCWRSRCQTVGDGDAKDRQDVCAYPVQVAPDLRIARCMEMIEPRDVIRAIEKYIADTPQPAAETRPAVSRQGSVNARKGEVTDRRTQENRRDNSMERQTDRLNETAAATAVPDARAKTANVLIDFRHGLGDAVQLTTVLLHLRHHHPDWQIDVAAGVGKLPAVPLPAGGDGSAPLYRYFFVRGRDPIDRRAYKHVFELAWDECATVYADSPSTKAEYCLRSVFHLEPIRELCRYELTIRPEAMAAAASYLESVCGPGTRCGGRYPAVLLHYQANTSTDKKDLPHDLARQICEAVIEARHVPVILDWDKRSPLPDGVRIFNPRADSPLWKDIGTGDCEVLAALIAQSSLFIGVDSGPLHVAGAYLPLPPGEGRGEGGSACSDAMISPTPVVAVWTGHHPLHYFSLADHVTHLVPADHAARLRGDRATGQAFFEKHYRHRVYRQLDDALTGLVQEFLADDEDGLLQMHGFWVRGDNAEQDLVIVRDIAEQDSYRIAELQLNGPVAVDVGAHIGVFSRAFKERHPAARVVAVECCPENIPALRRNVGDFATIVPAALTYEREVALFNAVYPGCVSTGGSEVVSRTEFEAMAASRATNGGDGKPAAPSPAGYWLDRRPLATVTLEELMTEHHLDHIDVLKLDCEGSEFSILENTTSLDRIGAIVGEYHGREAFQELVARKFGDWELRILRDEDPGTFWLLNPHFAQRAERGPRTSELAASAPTFSGGAGNLVIDVERGMAVETDSAAARVYDDAYFERYLAYEGTAVGNRLGRLRTGLVKKYCRTVLDIGIGAGTFLKQWAVAGCCCGGQQKEGEPQKKPCGCGEKKAQATPTIDRIRRAATPAANGYGYDVNPRGIAWLRERELFVDPYDHVPPCVEGVTFWDSLEHLPDPARLLTKLRVGTFVFVSLPILGDLQRLADSKHYKPGEHVRYFTHAGLTRYMAEQGFDLVESSRAETEAGRESIESFVFRKARGPALPRGWHSSALGDPLREIVPGEPLVLRTANGIGDICWLMVLAGSLKRRLEIPKLTLELQLAGDHRDDRAVEFARRFTAVDEVRTARFDIHLQPPAHEARLRYVPNGYAQTQGGDVNRGPYTLIINPWLEWQGRLEDFVPELEPQWDVLESGYRREKADIAAAASYSRGGELLGVAHTGHVCIHLCSRADNSTAGMNRGGRWSLGDWLELLKRLRTITDLPIYVLGAKEDADFACELIQRAARQVPRLFDLCGKTTTTEAVELLRQSSLTVSFASGLAIASCYLGVPTVTFWNAEGHSVSPDEEIWFSDSFATNWVPPQTLGSGLYHPAVYGRDNPDSVFSAVLRMLSSGRSPEDAQRGVKGSGVFVDGLRRFR